MIPKKKWLPLITVKQPPRRGVVIGDGVTRKPRPIIKHNPQATRRK
jgi:hypothetical protein